MSFKIVESWYEDELVSHTSIQMMQYSLSVVKDSNRFPQPLQMEKLWECEAAGIKPNTISTATCTSQILEMAECGIQPLEQLPCDSRAPLEHPQNHPPNSPYQILIPLRRCMQIMLYSLLSNPLQSSSCFYMIFQYPIRTMSLSKGIFSNHWPCLFDHNFLHLHIRKTKDLVIPPGNLEIEVHHHLTLVCKKHICNCLMQI